MSTELLEASFPLSVLLVITTLTFYLTSSQSMYLWERQRYGDILCSFSFDLIFGKKKKKNIRLQMASASTGRRLRLWQVFICIRGWQSQRMSPCRSQPKSRLSATPAKGLWTEAERVHRLSALCHGFFGDRDVFRKFVSPQLHTLLILKPTQLKRQADC